MTLLEGLLASLVIGEITDFLAAKYDGDKHPRLKKYLGLSGRLAKLLLQSKGGK